MQIVVVGAGAAGCFAAIEIKRRAPQSEVIVLEAGPKAMAKLAVTGGGRCNLTNSFQDITNLTEAYPRGDKLMRRALAEFSADDTRRWFAAEGVPTVVQSDQCVFPKSQDAMQVVGTLAQLMRVLGVRLTLGSPVREILPDRTVVTAEGKRLNPDAVLVTTGGSPKAEGLSFLAPLGLEIQPPLPSLFTFNIDCAPLKALMGTVVEDARLSIPGTRFQAFGPLLITHWGLSGPAALKLSAYAARHLAGTDYRSAVAVGWMGGISEQDCRAALVRLLGAAGHRNVANSRPETIPGRLWEHLLSRSGIRGETPAAELGKTAINKLVNTLISDTYNIAGKSRWREEFVTCGGVSLSEISLNTMESRKHPGIYFAGEVLDVDAITGGFNLQAAWSMGWCAAKAITEQ